MTIDHKNPRESVAIPLPYHLTDDFMLRAEITVPGRSDAADAQIWATYKIVNWSKFLPTSARLIGTAHCRARCFYHFSIASMAAHT